MFQRWAFLLPILLLPIGARAVTVGEALAAEKLIGEVDAMDKEQRAAFIGQHRDELNRALMTEQLVATIRHTVQVTALAAQHINHRPLLCGVILNEESGDDDSEVGGRPPLPPPAPLPEMVAAFNAELKKSLNLPDGPLTEARLDGIDVADVIANRMIADNKCDGKITRKRH